MAPREPAAASTRPLFLLGVARSGTTYLHHVLTEHPGIRLSYEGRLVREGEYLYRRCPNPGDRVAFGRLLARLAEIEAEEPLNEWLVETLRQRVDELFEEHRAEPGFAALVQQIYRKPHPVPCWGNKILRIESLADLTRLWPDARFLVLLRDPRAVYASQLRYFGTRLGYASIYWNDHASATRALAADQRFLVFRYEDFVERPEHWLEHILALVDLVDAERIRRMLESRPPHRESLDKWRQVLTVEQITRIESLCFVEMQRWGYVPEHATAPSRLGSVARGLETFREYRKRVPLDVDWWRRKQVLRRFLRTVRG